MTAQPYEAWQVWIRFASWTNVTADVEAMAGTITSTSGETSETDDTSGTLTLELRNPYQHYTPGNTQSPHYPYVKSGREIRLVEAVGWFGHRVFTGRLEWPEIGAWAQSSTSGPREQTITITAVDLLGWLDRAPTYVSNIGASVLGTSAAADLAAYYPMGDPGPRAYDAGPLSQPPLALVPAEPPLGSAVVDIPLSEVVSWRQVTAPGDDISVAFWNRANTADTSVAPYGAALSTPVTLTAGNVLTLAAWVKVSGRSSTPTAEMYAMSLTGTGESIHLKVQQASGMELNLTASAVLASGAMSIDFTGQAIKVPPDVWTLLTFQVALSTASGAQVVTVGDTAYTATASGAPPASATFDTVANVGWQWYGGLGHLQAYNGAAVDPTDQYAMGLHALERQTTGQRIRHILGYCGLTAAELGGVDDGCSVMQRVSLAGVRPTAALDDAVITEQGSLYAGGDGLPVFDDRRSLYTI